MWYHVGTLFFRFLFLFSFLFSHKKNRSKYIRKRQQEESAFTRKQKIRQKKKNENKSGCFSLETLSLRGCYNVRSRGLQAVAFSIGGTLKKFNIKGLPGKI